MWPSKDVLRFAGYNVNESIQNDWLLCKYEYLSRSYFKNSVNN